MKSILKATSILGTASLVPIAVGLLSAKAWAQLVGPAGYGLVSLVQNSVSIAAIMADLGVSTALVRHGSATNGTTQELAALWRAGVAAVAIPTLVVIVTLVVGRGPLAELALGGPDQAHQMLFCALALLVTIAGGLSMSMLNSQQRVSAMARASIWSSIVPVMVTLAIAARWGAGSIGAAVAAGALVRWAYMAWLLWRELGLLPWSKGPGAHLEKTKALMWFGVPVALSHLASSGIHLAVPMMVLQLLGHAAVGYYQSAYAIAVGSLSFLLTAFAQDYLPRISAAPADNHEVSRLVNQQHRLVLLAGFPIILAVKAAAPFLLPILYSRSFFPALGILRWLLVADLLKFSSWTLSFLILARCSGKTFLFTELVAGVSLLAGIGVGARFFGTAGLGLGFLFSYVVYWTTTWVVVRRNFSFRWDPSNLWALLAALIAAVLPQAMKVVLGGHAETITSAAVAFVAVIIGSIQLYRIWTKSEPTP